MNRKELIEAILKQKTLSDFTKKDAEIFTGQLICHIEIFEQYS
jgi:hypothetical protein